MERGWCPERMLKTCKLIVDSLYCLVLLGCSVAAMRIWFVGYPVRNVIFITVEALRRDAKNRLCTSYRGVLLRHQRELEYRYAQVVHRILLGNQKKEDTPHEDQKDTLVKYISRWKLVITMFVGYCPKQKDFQDRRSKTGLPDVKLMNL